jgi:hypothetical protein
MFRFSRWTSGSLRIPAQSSTVAIKRARIKTVPRCEVPPSNFSLSTLTCVRYRTALIVTVPILVVAGIEASGLLVPKEAWDRLNAHQKDWADFKKKRAELNKKLGENAQTPDLAKATKGGNSNTTSATPIWIPIPIWTTLKKAPEYKATDPEWKEFLKLEQDPARVQKLKDGIARNVATSILDGLPPPVERATVATSISCSPLVLRTSTRDQVYSSPLVASNGQAKSYPTTVAGASTAYSTPPSSLKLFGRGARLSTDIITTCVRSGYRKDLVNRQRSPRARPRRRVSQASRRQNRRY